ncbi:hypothetical protein GCM10027517_03810 [Phycicoccus ginsengisoli]
MVGGVSRRDWRMLVQRSRLPSSVKVTLLAHASMSRHHFHDDLANEHAITRKRLAHAVGKDERSVQRHLRRAESDGWLVRHRNGHNGIQQSVFHYVTPSRPVLCTDVGCWSRETSRETGRETRTAPYVGRQKCLPYVVTYRHDRDTPSGALRCRPHHALSARPQTASTDEMTGWPRRCPGLRLCPLTELASPLCRGATPRHLSRVRHLHRAPA